MSKKTTAYFAIVIFLLAGMFLISINLGGINITYSRLFKGLFVEYDEKAAIIYDLRLPRIIIAMLAGAALSVSGVLLQASLKNPLADPGIIGITAGANLMAVVITALFPALFFLVPVFAFIGGMLACIIIYLISWKADFSPVRIILAGIAVSYVFTGIMQVFSSFGGANVTGSMAVVNANITMKTWADVRMLWWYSIIAQIPALLAYNKCNLLGLEDKTVRGLGINVTAVRVYISVVAVILASITTAVAGAVAFLGLVVPHLGRLMIGSEHKTLIPFTMILGAFVMLLADTAGRIISYPYEIPAAVIMSVVGGIFFIILLIRSDKTYGS